MSKSWNGLFAIASAALIYMLFVTGGLIPYSAEDPQKAFIKAALLIFSLVAIGRKIQKRSAFAVGAFLLVGLVAGLLALMTSGSVDFSIEKIDGAILCTVFIVLLIDACRIKCGENQLQNAFLLFSAFVLLLTVAYKIQFGFFDRSVRFFLNGPIVYGWLMGGVAVLSFHRWRESKRVGFLFLFFGFVAALVWTESKGSILAFFAAYSVYFISNSKRKILHGVIAIFAISILYFFLYEPFLDLLGDSRLAAGARFLSGQLGDADEGSFGIRESLQNEALANFLSSPWFGIGIGAFRYGDFIYPHNQHLELFAEMGVFVGTFHLVFVLVSFCRASNFLKSLIVLFAVGGSFSGDASYLRFLYVACLLSLISRPRSFSEGSRLVANRR